MNTVISSGFGVLGTMLQFVLQLLLLILILVIGIALFRAVVMGMNFIQSSDTLVKNLLQGKNQPFQRPSATIDRGTAKGALKLGMIVCILAALSVGTAAATGFFLFLTLVLLIIYTLMSMTVGERAKLASVLSKATNKAAGKAKQFGNYTKHCFDNIRRVTDDDVLAEYEDEDYYFDTSDVYCIDDFPDLTGEEERRTEAEATMMYKNSTLFEEEDEPVVNQPQTGVSIFSQPQPQPQPMLRPQPQPIQQPQPMLFDQPESQIEFPEQFEKSDLKMNNKSSSPTPSVEGGDIDTGIRVFIDPSNQPQLKPQLNSITNGSYGEDYSFEDEDEDVAESSSHDSNNTATLDFSEDDLPSDAPSLEVQVQVQEPAKEKDTSYLGDDFDSSEWEDDGQDDDDEDWEDESDIDMDAVNWERNNYSNQQI